MESVDDVLGRIRRVLHHPNFSIGDTEITPWTLGYLPVPVVLPLLQRGHLEKRIAPWLLERYGLEPAAS